MFSANVLNGMMETTFLEHGETLMRFVDNNNITHNNNNNNNNKRVRGRRITLHNENIEIFFSLSPPSILESSKKQSIKKKHSIFKIY